MNNAAFLLAFMFLLYGCTGTSSKTVVKKEPIQFKLSDNDLKLLTGDSCAHQVCIDSLDSIAQYFDSLHYYTSIQNQHKGKHPLWVNQCIAFSFSNDGIKPGRRIIVEKIPKTYGMVPTTIPVHSILLVEIYNASFAFTSGNELHQASIPADSVNGCIKRLFLNAPDTSRYGEKVVSLLFPGQDITLLNRYLSQLVIGYVLAQRDICRDIFHKDLKDATQQEVNKLKALRPLRFNILVKGK